MSLPPDLQRLTESEAYRKALSLPETQEETYTLFAQGEYNQNWRFTHPVSGKELLLRVNFGSQMHLADQIGYEYHALKLLEKSGRTPKALYVDGTRTIAKQGILVMEVLPGHALDYATELGLAAEILADIHSIPLPENEVTLQRPSHPLSAMLEECEEMFAVFVKSAEAAAEQKNMIRHLLDLGRQKISRIRDESPLQSIINTELNNTNFLINGAGEANYLIDWEKPLIGDPAQDLGHFLAPTTTFWKTDTILSEREALEWTKGYIAAVCGRFKTEELLERSMVFRSITCLRGITWCAMAWVEYRRPERALSNESTRKKLDAYLDMAFLSDAEAVLRAL